VQGDADERRATARARARRHHREPQPQAGRKCRAIAPDARRNQRPLDRRGAAQGQAPDRDGAMSLFEKDAPRPLADRLRPKRLDEVVGQDHLLKPDGPIGRMVAARRLASMILWGPPGCGKTTIARLLAEATSMHFEPLSAVFSGVADLRKIFEA